MLGIRTFDQIQAELSVRLNQQSTLETRTEQTVEAAEQAASSDGNPQESSFRKPTNLLRDFRANIDTAYS